ncbi:immune inhibitor A domain-containing protein [Nocardioides ungokensis]|uniref:immune inhibitor A domain-containing protein n=1 Tax=Nocardioides ungokensis TaxID=1643322 RepID=UPI0015DDC589|nr:immune inhibitor A domain-containing protein [Nocardioides ungokensis]
MRRTKLVALATASLISAAVTLPLSSTQAGAVTGTAAGAAPSSSGNAAPSDSLTPKWRAKFEERNQKALEKRLRQGGRGTSVKVGKHAYGRVAQTGQDKIFVVLAEFGNTQHSAYAGQSPDAQKVDGPLHNQIPEPDRSKDNSTLWKSDYNQAHYQNMYFNRMKKFYEDQSSGKYSVDGQVTEWVKVPFNEARYGRDKCGSIVCSNTWFLIRDALAEWTQSKLDAGWSMTKIQDYLKTFDHQDRYDFDGDGNFNEPDGYIDHFQIVHAGGDQADGDPVYGSDAIWSHRWNAQIEPFGTGPEGGAPIGGVNVGEGGVSDPNGANVQIPNNPTGVWVNDYTIQPENGGLSVFSHEFGHDLGLPDLYDTSGNTGGASNTVEHWSLMSQSRGTAQKDQGIGDQPMPFGAWEKFQLGWLDYDTARPGHDATYKIRPGQSTSGDEANGLIVLLPNKHTTLQLGAPCATCGSRYYYSDKGDDLDTTMTREVPAVSGTAPLTAKVRYDIEQDYDYAYLEASSDGGQTWSAIQTSESEPSNEANPDGTGITGSTDGEWVDLTADVPDGTNALRWEYRTDGGVALNGFQVDNITLDGNDIGTAETGAEGWTFDGFRTTTGTEDQSFTNAYFVDNRQYVGRDRLLQHIYNFGDIAHTPDKGLPALRAGRAHLLLGHLVHRQQRR